MNILKNLLFINELFFGRGKIEARRDSSEILNFWGLSLDDSYKLDSYKKKCVSKEIALADPFATSTPSNTVVLTTVER